MRLFGREAFGVLLSLVLPGCVRRVEPRPEPARDVAPAHGVVARRFELRSSFWVNLHQTLLSQCRPGRSGGGATPETPERDAPSGASPEWNAAVAFYRERFAQRSLFDEELSQLNLRLGDVRDARGLRAAGIPDELASVLEGAARDYHQRWPEQDRANQQWIARVHPLLERWSADMVADLERLYQVHWPSEPMRVEVSGSAGPFGAFTSEQPPLITISSLDPLYGGEASLEMLFHEASHGGPIEKLARTLSRECEAQRKDCGDLWHALLFYTVGAVAQRHLGPGYVPYGQRSGVYERVARWRGYSLALEQEWRPYLEGKVDAATALSALVRGL
ncbi:hypothetical protein LY474_19380 [Myxococcus stipitatus]|uniref:hypothetical protein n=1 Tax=Myxococcus stipitatus TaxID=83455 RepID=UPI001F311E06|nr:hypothetical protein [Myxococcus stipitatus]MCE9669965.1 hypothetical protein [Myxococcus stipitatus]